MLSLSDSKEVAEDRDIWRFNKRDIHQRVVNVAENNVVLELRALEYSMVIEDVLAH